MKLTRYEPTQSTACPGCKHEIGFHRFSSMGDVAPHFYCNRCSNAFFRDSDRDRIRAEQPGPELLARISATLPACPCGGQFGPAESPKCPHCATPLRNRLDPVERLTDPGAVLVEGAGLVTEEG